MLPFFTVYKINRSLLCVRWQVSLLIIMTVLVTACSGLTPATTSIKPTPAAPRVALVLGGGGAKGFAHIGVIKVLEKNGIAPTLIVGTSVGSLVGSLYASGYSAAQLERLALATRDSTLTDLTLSDQGFIRGIKLKNFVNTQVNNRPIESFPIKFAAIAAEKNTLKKAVFASGDAGLAVQASCSVPNIFIAPRVPEKTGKKYVDGGVVSLVPVDSARDLGADIIIAVDVTEPTKNLTLNSLPAITSLNSFWGLLESNLATYIAGSATHRTVSSQKERLRADILITPNVGHISTLDTSQRKTLIAAGEAAATLKIKIIKQLIKDKSVNTDVRSSETNMGFQSNPARS